MYEYQAKIIRVVDGDTVNVEIDLGFNINFTQPLRLHGINAPELSTDEGKVIRDILKQKIEGKIVTIQTIKDRKEKYGRYLATLILPGFAPDINQWLVNEGYAVLYKG